MELVPTAISLFQVNFTKSQRHKKWQLEQMKKLCADFGTSCTISPNETIVIPIQR
jgi:hypothetical protein